MEQILYFYDILWYWISDIGCEIAGQWCGYDWSWCQLCCCDGWVVLHLKYGSSTDLVLAVELDGARANSANNHTIPHNLHTVKTANSSHITKSTQLITFQFSIESNNNILWFNRLEIIDIIKEYIEYIPLSNSRRIGWKIR